MNTMTNADLNLSTISLLGTDGERVVFNNARVVGIKGGVIWIAEEERDEKKSGETLRSALGTEDMPTFTTQAFTVKTRGFALEDVAQLHIGTHAEDTSDVDSLTSIDLECAGVEFREDGSLI